MKAFASDNWAGVHPQIMDAIINANTGHQGAYGDDDFTKKAEKRFKEIFGEQAKTYFVYNGTGANIIALESISHSFNSVICSEHAHIHVDECGAIEKHAGVKLIAIPSADGKLHPEQIKDFVKADRIPHQSIPAVISITQSTELGTVYSVEEIKALAQLAHDNGLFLHVDGARISNAVASLGLSFKEIITDAGVDVLSFGGTKNGLMFGEAVVFLNPKLGEHVELYRKQGMHLASKMRFVAAQFLALFENDLWKTNADHSNAMAQILAEKLDAFPEIRITQEVQSNGVWAVMPDEIAEKLQKSGFFYPWDERASEYRLMCSWDTTEEDIENLVSNL